MSLNITAIWEALFDTAPTGAQLSFFNAEDSASGDAATIASIIATPEVQSTVIPVIQIIQLATGLAPDPLQLAAWVNVANSEGLLAVAQAWVNNSNFQAQYGTTSVSIIDGIYAKAFGVIPTTQDVTAWSTQTPAQILYAFATSTIYTDALAPYVNQYLTDVMDAVSGAPGAVFPSGSLTSIPTTTPVETYVLTTGVDTITQTGSSLNGVAAPAALGDDAIVGTLGPALFGGTLNPLDTIAPGGSNNSLTLADNFGGQVIPLGANISNIQSLTLIEEVNAGTGAGNRFDTTVITTPAGAAVLSQFTATSAGTGTDWYNAGAMTNVTATADAGSVNLTGGANDTVTAVKGITISGAADSVMATNSTSGNVTVTGGTNVTTTQNGTGNTIISGETGQVNATSTNPGSTVTVNNGTNVTVTAQGNVSIGATAAPTGAIAVTINGPADAFEGALPTVSAVGGTSATVNTTGSNSVTLGSTVAPIGGNVQITDTNSGPSPDVFTVLATGSVNLTSTPTSGTINIGQDALLNASGTGLKNADQPTGNVVVNNSETFGSKTYYGSGGVNIDTNGATSVSVTGGTGGVNITDLETTKATGGANVGDAIGTSTLSSVSLSGVGGTTITSDALTSLSISNSVATVTVDETPMAPSNTDPALALSLTLSNYAGNVTDNTASSVTVGTSGSSADSLILDASKATSVTFQNTANLTLTGGSLGSVTSIVADNSGGSLALGNVGAFAANLTSINATGSTGPVSVELSEGLGSKISFNGAGGGVDTVTLDLNTLGTGTSVVGATGSTLVANYAASITDTALHSETTGFTTLGLGANAIDAHSGVYSPVVTSDTVTVSGNFATGDVVSVTIGVTTYSTTVTLPETDAQIAAALAGAALPSGDSITYSGGTSFTISNAAGLPTISGSTQPAASLSSAIFVVTPVATQVYTEAFTGSVTTGGTLSQNINGTIVSIGTFGTETGAQVASALEAAINAAGTSYTASVSGGTITYTANNAGATSDGNIGTVAKATTAGTYSGIGNAITSTAGANEEDAFNITGVYAAGDVISGTIDGHNWTYTVTAPGASNDTIIVADVVAAINASGASADVTASQAGHTVQVLSKVSGAMTDSVTATAISGTVTPSVLTTASPGGGYDATGFTALTVGGTAGDVAFVNVGAGVGLTVTASNPHIINYELATLAATNTLPLTVDGVTATVATHGIQDVNITSAGTSGNTVTIDDSAAKAITVTGSEGLTLTMQSDTGGAENSSNSLVTSINASGSSGAVTVTGVPISALGATFTGGAGFLTANGEGHLAGTGEASSGVDVFNVGSGGGNIGIGFGGAVVNFTGSTNATNWLVEGTGSETVNLLAANPVGSQIDVWTNSTSGAGSVATVNNFNITDSSKSSDVLAFNSVEKVVVNAASQFLDQAGFSPDLNYSASNGIVTFAGTLLDPISNFALETLITAAAVIDGRSGGNSVDAFAFDGNTYVVAIGSNPIVSGPGSDAAIASDVSVTILNGVTGVQGFAATQFGMTAASNTILASGNINGSLATSATTSGSVNATYNDQGFMFASDTSQAPGSTSTTYENLAAAALVVIASGTNDHAITTTQVGASGTNSLVVFNETPGDAISTLTVNGDNTVTFDMSVGSLTVTSFVDATNTTSTIDIVGGGALTIGGITDSALTTINASTSTGSLNLTDALSSQTINLGSGVSTLAVDGSHDMITQQSGGSISGATGSHANGDGDTILLDSGGVGSAGNHFVAAGAADTIVLGNGTNWMDANNNGDSITLGTGANTVSATGVGDMITFSGTATATSTVEVGNGANVTYGTTSGGHFEIVDLTAVNNTVGASTTSGNFTTLNNVVDGTGDQIRFDSGIDTFHTAAVDVAADATLAAALNSAAAAAGTVTGGHATVEWFQWSGNTYLVAAESGAHTALNATDYVVEITGVVDLATANFVAGHFLTL